VTSNTTMKFLLFFFVSVFAGHHVYLRCYSLVYIFRARQAQALFHSVGAPKSATEH
jgi:hypothetical protein